MVDEREVLFERYLERLSGGALSGTGQADRQFPDFEMLRTLEAVARERDIASAARSLGRYETEVLEHLRSLEAGLGVALLRRLAPEVALTAEGTRLAQGIRAGLAEIADALDALDALRLPRFRSRG